MPHRWLIAADFTGEEGDVGSESLRTSRLDQYLHAIDLLAVWQHAKWGHHDPSFGLKERRVFLRSLATSRGVPACFIVHLGNRLVGSANIVDHDLPSGSRYQPWSHFSPWLASVYVDQAARGLGAGSLIVRRAMHEASVAGCSRLYLYTPDKMSFYERLGWTRLDDNKGPRGVTQLATFDFAGETQTVMTSKLKSSSGSFLDEGKALDVGEVEESS